MLDKYYLLIIIFIMNVAKPIIKQSTIDFANKWNVGVELKTKEEFFKYKVEAPYIFYKSPFGSDFGIKWHDTNRNDRTIIMCNNKSNAEKNSDRIILHELCHCIFELRPNLIDDFVSPMISLDYKMIIDNQVSHNMKDNTWLKNSGFNITGSSNIEGYLAYYNQELIDQGLLTESGEFTFDRSRVSPKESWFKKAN